MSDDFLADVETNELGFDFNPDSSIAPAGEYVLEVIANTLKVVDGTVRLSIKFAFVDNEEEWDEVSLMLQQGANVSRASAKFARTVLRDWLGVKKTPVHDGDLVGIRVLALVEENEWEGVVRNRIKRCAPIQDDNAFNF